MKPGQQQWNVENYKKFASFVPELGQPILELLNPMVGERILDLGCGDGVLTEKLQKAGCDVIGVDSSPEMVQVAAARGLTAWVMDARKLIFESGFDAVFSNAVLHWVKEAELAVSGIARALKPGGRFVAEFGGYGNIKTIEDALIEAVELLYPLGRSLSPWYYPTPEAYGALLENHRLQVQSICLIPRPTPLPNGMRGWLKTFAEPFLAPFPPDFHSYILDNAEYIMRPALCDARGNWHADYVRLRVVARKPQE